MKQIQIEYKNTENLKYELAKVIKSRKMMPYSAIVFQIYAMTSDRTVVNEICELIDSAIPDAVYYGSEAYSNVFEGNNSAAQAIINCSIYENESTQMALFFVEKDSSLVDPEKPNSALQNIYSKNPWIKSMEITASANGANTMLSDVYELDFKDDVFVFGGIACNPADVSDEDTYVFAKDHGFTTDGMVIFAAGGSEYFVECTYSVGWRPLGKHMTITECDGTHLKSIDDIPVLELYEKYFGIVPGEHFSKEIVMFPFLIEKYGVDCLSTPVRSTPDGDLLMAVNNTIGSSLRMSYGEPGAIINSVRRYAASVVDFAPDVIHAFSCCGRVIFLDKNISSETQLLDSIAPTGGFYARGQIYLANKHLFKFTNTLVIAAFREGEKIDFGLDLNTVKIDYVDAPFMSRLMNYITVSSEELEEYNNRLKIMAITDGMTQLFNRTETQKRITKEVRYRSEKADVSALHLMMFDIDNFKSVNDTYGHDLGDVVIKSVAAVLREHAARFEKAFAGRWGGEEFMICIPGINDETALSVAEDIRRQFADIEFDMVGHKTISIGAVSLKENESADDFCKRVDDELYRAKNTGKNKVCSDF